MDTRARKQRHRSSGLTEVLEDSSDVQHKQERALQAIQVVATSGFVRNSRSLKRSCLAICNSYRECVPLRYLKVGLKASSTLLTSFFPGLLPEDAEGNSRVLPHRRVHEVNWIFDDRKTIVVMDSDYEDEEEEEEEEEEEDEENEEGEEGKVERGPVTVCDINMSKVRWPEGVRKISLSRFNRSVDDVKWPACLEVLSFHMHSRSEYESETMAIFNMSLNGVTFPAGLRDIYLGFKFNQPIENVDWPEGLEKLSMAGFNQPIQDVQWPSGLKTLEFSKPCQFEYRDKVREVPWDRQRAGFNQPLGTFLPMSIDTLWLSDTFNQSLEGVTWPSGLTVLGLGTELTQESIDGVEWPPSLRTLVCEDVFIDIYDPPSGCRVVLIQSYVADMNEEGPVGWCVDDENYDSNCSYDSE